MQTMNVRPDCVLYVMYKLVNGNMPTNITNYFSYRQYLYGLRKTTLQFDVPKPSTNSQNVVLPIVVQIHGTVYQFKTAIDRVYAILALGDNNVFILY